MISEHLNGICWPLVRLVGKAKKGLDRYSYEHKYSSAKPGRIGIDNFWFLVTLPGTNFCWWHRHSIPD
jgi:hypothetical protein